MKKKIVVTIIVLFVAIGAVEFFGVPKEICLEEGNYKSCYTDYYVYPHFFDYWDCYNFLPMWFLTIPCGAHTKLDDGSYINLDKENTYADLLSQLCVDKITNSQKIIDWYKKKGKEFHKNPSSDTEFICKEGTKFYGRM